ncbi:universal stress protein [Francisella frigiditurris]|uniref:Universal stress family protein n=1 Tax=Francisella frigiditurris TaxID=1542390 RepID=A0A1J0KRZ7_9GAMM|nr:universal stress protein [Francisella frigiditurris]APC96396.1 universal stress family protein [Francisella frigiditurris]
MSYNKILLAVDVYEKADVVINSAIAFAKKNGVKKISVVTVVDCVAPFAPSVVDFQYTLEKEAKKALSQVKDKLVGFEVKADVLVGNPSVEIVTYAEESACDLIVIGSHAKHGFNLILGSVANAVLHKAKCDVLTVRVQEEDRAAVDYKNILIPTDLENDSCIVAKKANDIAKLYGASVDTVFVIPNDTVSLMSYEMEKVEKALENFVSNNKLGGKKAVLIGGVANGVLEQAKENKADLIVVGSHRRGAIGRFFLGSTANGILHGADSDVLVVKLK